MNLFLCSHLPPSSTHLAPQESNHLDPIGNMAIIYARDNQFHGRGVNLAVISIVFTLVAICLVASRLTSRISAGRKLHEDDYAIIASVVRFPSRLDVHTECNLANSMPQVFSIGLGISNVVSE